MRRYYWSGYRFFAALRLAVAACLLAPVAWGEEADAAAPRVASEWLERMGMALTQTGYRGVFVYARGDHVSSMHIAHRFRDGRVEERLVVQDGASSEIVRKGTAVICVLPRRGRIRLDQVIPSGPFAEAFANQLMPVSRWYHPQMDGEDRVAGYRAVVVVLNARDEHRYSYRLWLETETGLLIKSHVRTRSGSILENFQFTSLEITDDLADHEFEIQSQGATVTREVSGSSEETPVAMQTPRQWRLGWKPEGFMPAASPQEKHSNVVAFSDGLATFSVFVEPSGSMVMPRSASRIGATTAYMKTLSGAGMDLRITVVGEIPPQTAMRVAESVEVDWPESGRESP